MQSAEQSDQSLVEQTRAGDDTAFEMLMQRHKRPVLNFVYRMLGDAGEAEDVAQEVFVNAHRRIGDYRPRAKFSTWLFAMARNAAIDRLRYRQRHPTEALSNVGVASLARGPSAEAAAREIGQHIAAAVAALPEDQRTAIVLAEYHGLSHAEIAGIMHCSEKSVESRLYRARQALRTRLLRWLA
jgi:RNA polymerase sigma-70 factor (ECF subfamily)